jgi:hypothetical protein
MSSRSCAAVRADGRTRGAQRRGDRSLQGGQPRTGPAARTARHRDCGRQCGLRRGHRRQHRVGGHLLAHRLSRDGRSPLQAQHGSRLDRRQLGARHADPAERALDRLGHPHRAVDRPAVHRRHRAGHPARADACGVPVRLLAHASGQFRRPGQGGNPEADHALRPARRGRHRHPHGHGAGRHLDGLLHAAGGGRHRRAARPCARGAQGARRARHRRCGLAELVPSIATGLYQILS